MGAQDTLLDDLILSLEGILFYHSGKNAPPSSFRKVVSYEWSDALRNSHVDSFQKHPNSLRTIRERWRRRTLTMTDLGSLKVCRTLRTCWLV